MFSGDEVSTRSSPRWKSAFRRFDRGTLRSGIAGCDLERTLVDVLDRPDLSGSWEEIWRSLESVEFFDLDKVVEYALLLGNATTGAKVGFFLEQHREPLMVEDRHLKALYDMRPRQPHYWTVPSGHPVVFVSEWNLVVPREVLERAWGEVL
jgi:predicted transcriptional regulator of viral defense system